MIEKDEESYYQFPNLLVMMGTALDQSGSFVLVYSSITTSSRMFRRISRSTMLIRPHAVEQSCFLYKYLSGPTRE